MIYSPEEGPRNPRWSAPAPPPRGRLVDEGKERVDIYPTVESHDALGNPRHDPANTPVSVYVTLHPAPTSSFVDLSAGATTWGQRKEEKMQFVTLEPLPLGAWSKIVARGREWDVVDQPERGPYTGVVRVLMKARTSAPASSDTYGTREEF